MVTFLPDRESGGSVKLVLVLVVLLLALSGLWYAYKSSEGTPHEKYSVNNEFTLRSGLECHVDSVSWWDRKQVFTVTYWNRIGDKRTIQVGVKDFYVKPKKD